MGWEYKANLRGPAGHDAVGAAATDVAIAGFILDEDSDTREALDTVYGGQVELSQFYLDADAGDYAITLERALAHATPLGKSVLLSKIYPIKSTVNLNSGDSIVGRGPRTGLKTFTPNAPIESIRADYMTKIHLDNFLVDGNVTDIIDDDLLIRGIRFRHCSDILLSNMTVQYIADWGTSFELSSNVKVTDHTHRYGGMGQPGGKDGVHFLDCHDCVIDGAIIWSGDDCVSITSEFVGSARIDVRNITGYSEIAAVLTVGNEGPTTMTNEDLFAENISTYQPEGISTPCAWVLKMLAQNDSLLRRITIQGVHGISRNPGLQISAAPGTSDRITDVTISDVNVVSTQQSSVELRYVDGFVLSGVSGVSMAAGFDGIVCFNCRYGSVNAMSLGSSNWGIQLNACSYIDLLSCVMRDNGAGSFAGGDGGNGAIVNCTDVAVLGGSFMGTTLISRYGIRTVGGSGIAISATTRRAGVTP